MHFQCFLDYIQGQKKFTGLCNNYVSEKMTMDLAALTRALNHENFQHRISIQESFQHWAHRSMEPPKRRMLIRVRTDTNIEEILDDLLTFNIGQQVLTIALGQSNLNF